MPIINLTIKGKQAVGDGTQIVCMNSDYVVRIAFEDCDTLLNSPYKSLVVKSTLYYQESPVDEIVEDGTTYLQAVLPPIENQQTVELGVCGRDEDNPLVKPTFSSIPAVFQCAKSVLCGAVVLKRDPKLSEIKVVENGTYYATDKDADGFFKVDVDIPAVVTESRSVDLDMAFGDQTIVPTTADRFMTQVIVRKPGQLIPKIIVSGVNIGGVVGEFEKIFTEQTIYADGEYTPPEGIDGFSKVNVQVGKCRTDKVMRIGDKFHYDYVAKVEYGVELLGKDTGKDKIIVRFINDLDKVYVEAVDLGECIVTIKDFDAGGNIVNTIYYGITVNAEGDHTLPAEASTVDEMNAHLERGVVGSIIKYTGETTEGFVHGATYIVEEVE